jgi:gliding motility associated protien GldN
MKKCFLIILLDFIALNISAQFGYNPDVVNPVLEDDIMFRKVVVRKLNFKEKQNRSFAPDIEDYNFPYQLYQAIIGTGKQRPVGLEINSYVESFFNELYLGNVPKNKATKLDPNEYRAIMDDATRAQQLQDEPDKVLPKEVERNLYGCSSYDPQQQKNFLFRYSGPGAFSTMEIVEEVVFDKRRSRMYVNIISMKLTAVCEEDDGQGNKKQVEKQVAIVRYKEVDRYFRALYVESNQKLGRWYNPKNDRRHMCVMDAFELRLFSSRIIRVSNPENVMLAEISDKNNPVDELYKAQEAEMELMEFEHNLWEF